MADKLKPNAMDKANVKLWAKELSLPVLLDRAGGTAEFTVDDWKRLEEKYGGRVAMRVEPIPDGIRITLHSASDPGLERAENFTNAIRPAGIDSLN